jgi:hypothetical protein
VRWLLIIVLLCGCTVSLHLTDEQVEKIGNKLEKIADSHQEMADAHERAAAVFEDMKEYLIDVCRRLQKFLPDPD